jgi:L-amino acid N-acyltransferase YncA
LDIGTLALLQVEENHKRKGYGSLITAALSKEFAQLGYDVIATVINKNAKSISLFEKLKFKNCGKTYWLDTTGFK